MDVLATVNCRDICQISMFDELKVERKNKSLGKRWKIVEVETLPKQKPL